MKIKFIQHKFQILISKVAISVGFTYVYACILICSGKWYFFGRRRSIFLPKVIVFSRAGGNEDIKKIAGKLDVDVIFIFVPRALIKILFFHYFSDTDISDATYRPGDFLEQKNKYKTHWVKILRFLRQNFNLCGCIGFNIIYFSELKFALDI